MAALVAHRRPHILPGMLTPGLPPFIGSQHSLAGWLNNVAAWSRASHRRHRQSEIAWSWARLVCFGLFVVGGYFVVADPPWLGAPFVVVGLAGFVASLREYHRADRAVSAFERLATVAVEARDRIDSAAPIMNAGCRPAQFDLWRELVDRDPGVARAPLGAQEIDDLDVFAEPLGLMGLLNRCSSPVGEARLAMCLTNPLLDAPAIERRQQAVQWLAKDGAARLELMAAAVGFRKLPASLGVFYQTLRDAAPLGGAPWASFLKWWSAAAPLALIFALFASFAGTAAWAPFVGIVLLNAVVASTVLDTAREKLRPWLNLEPVIAELCRFHQLAIERLPGDGLLGDLRQDLIAAMTPECLPRLHRRVPLTYFGLSGILHTVVDWLVFWDFQLLCVLERCYLPNRARLMAAVAALGECEMLCSLAAFSAEQPAASWPRFRDTPALDIQNGRHPLIAPGEAVANSARLNAAQCMWVITGSNMAGKSTFLRMVGANVLLAQNGAAVCAESIGLSPLRIMTDLRIRDDLSRKESYFLAEVRQVRRMIDAAADPAPVLTLIDEPFRGTNSAERVAAAGAVMAHLASAGGLHLIATHDESLAAQDFGGRAANYHFEESFDADRLVFDYVLRPGPARSRNALRVLEAEAYPPDLIAAARKLAGEKR